MSTVALTLSYMMMMRARGVDAGGHHATSHFKICRYDQGSVTSSVLLTNLSIPDGHFCLLTT
jgi:hypothetical protein